MDFYVAGMMAAFAVGELVVIVFVYLALMSVGYSALKTVDYSDDYSVLLWAVMKESFSVAEMAFELAFLTVDWMVN